MNIGLTINVITVFDSVFLANKTALGLCIESLWFVALLPQLDVCGGMNPTFHYRATALSLHAGLYFWNGYRRKAKRIILTEHIYNHYRNTSIIFAVLYGCSRCRNIAPYAATAECGVNIPLRYNCGSSVRRLRLFYL